MADAPTAVRVEEFLDFMLTYYIDTPAQFPPNLWASDDLDAKRTTNGCESYHKQLNSLFYAKHPNIFTFMDVFSYFIKYAELQIKDLSRGESGRTPRREVVRKRKLHEIKQKYESGEIERDDYITEMGLRNQPVINM